MDLTQAELLISVTTFLEKQKIPYMITGAWSVIYFGRPRASHDIDFIVEIAQNEIPWILKAFATLPDEFQMQESTIIDAIEKKGMFNIMYLPRLLKLDFWLLKEDAFDKVRFIRRKRVQILGQSMYVASAEDTILQKLRWYKQSELEKHIIDAAFVYHVQKKDLDMPYLKKWIKNLDVVDYFNKLLKIDIEQYI